jgi:hypothetical protein
MSTAPTIPLNEIFSKKKEHAQEKPVQSLAKRERACRLLMPKTQ